MGRCGLADWPCCAEKWGGGVNVGRPKGGRPRAGGIHRDRASFSCAGSPNVKGKWGWLKPQASGRGHHSSHPVSSGPAHSPPGFTQAALPPREPLGFCTLNSRRHISPVQEILSPSGYETLLPPSPQPPPPPPVSLQPCGLCGGLLTASSPRHQVMV